MPQAKTAKLALPLAAMLALTPMLLAQTVAPASDPKTDDGVVQLETFVVNTDRDIGYVAVDSLAGGRTNTPIKLTPAAMS
ncbi:MAG TPA: hypothetical protein VK477_08900, partial [Acidobacteriota bacterium]|nr:hypothetical protein [Acidobacteriota bacterium]